MFTCVKIPALHQVGLMGDVVLGFVLCCLFLIASLVILLRG